MDFSTLQKQIEGEFGSSLLFALVFGSRARDENRADSDIDLMIVTSDPFISGTKVNDFKKFFVELQHSSGLDVDTQYPGEYITQFELEKAIQGYGFTYNDRQVVIEEIYADGWDSFNEYRQWLAAMAGPNRFLCGDKQLFDNYQERALKTLVLLSVAKEAYSFSKDGLINSLCYSGKEYLGFCDTPFTRQFLAENLTKALDALTAEKIMVRLDKYMVDYNACIKSLPLLKNVRELRLQDKFIGGRGGDKLDSIVDLINKNWNHLTTTARTIDYISEEQVRRNFQSDLTDGGESVSEILTEVDANIRKGSINQFSKNYIAFPDSGNSYAGLLADLTIPFLNQNLIATSKSAPTGTFAEIEVIRWFRKLIGYPESSYPENAIQVGGFSVHGGVLANTIGILAAREKAFPEARLKGMGHYEQIPILLVAGETINHYSHIASFWWLGLGEENVISVKINSEYKFDLDDLRNKLSLYTNDPRYKVVGIIAQAGDSRTTTIDNLDEIARIAKEYDTWLHVDACHGGTLLFSSTLRTKLKGIEQADSVSIDPHKGLGVTYPCSLILFRDINDLARLSKSTDITINKGGYDLGQITPFIGSKSFMSLKLWFTLKHLGLQHLEELVDFRFELAQSWAYNVQNSKYFKVMNDIGTYTVVFSCDPEKLEKSVEREVGHEEISKLNRFVHDTAYKEGHITIHNFDIVDYPNYLGLGQVKLRVLGVAFGNALTEKADFGKYIAYLDNLVTQYYK